MKLYLTPGVCSLAAHIALREAGIQFEMVRVDLRNKKLPGGADYLAVNSKGYVPALQLDDGAILTENVAVLQYIADLNPAAKLAPPAGTLDRYRLEEWLSFINSEIHKAFTPLFSPEAKEETRQYARDNLTKRLGYVRGVLGARRFLMGEQFTVADGYLFTVLRWAPRVHFDLTPWPELTSYLERIAARAHVIEAMTAEGLIKH